MNCVGIDHHRQYSHLTVMDQEDQVLRSGQIPNVQVESEKFLEGLEQVEAVIETGLSSYTMVDVLEQHPSRGLDRRYVAAEGCLRQRSA